METRLEKKDREFKMKGCRLVAVDPGSGVIAQESFAVRPRERMERVLELVQEVKLPKGTRVLFLGDSLTAHFPGRNYSSLMFRAFKWRFGDDVEVINAGIGGDNILRISERLKLL